MKTAWDKFFLFTAAAIVLGLSAWFIFKAINFKNQFPLPDPVAGGKLPETKTPETKEGSTTLANPAIWDPVKVEIDGKIRELPLFVSIPIIEKEGVAIDILDPSAQPLHPPLTNKWLVDHELKYLSQGVKQYDPDGDGFSNEEEFEGKTNPQSADDHPPFAQKLRMISRKAQTYRIEFAAKPDSKTFQLRRLQTAKWPKDTFFKEIGKITDDKQIRLDSFKEDQVKRRGITTDASILTVTYLPKGTKHDLVRRVPQNIPTYFSELEFTLVPGEKFIKAEGEEFTLSKDPGNSYRIIKVNENSTEVEYTDSKGKKATFNVNIR